MTTTKKLKNSLSFELNLKIYLNTNLTNKKLYSYKDFFAWKLIKNDLPINYKNEILINYKNDLNREKILKNRFLNTKIFDKNILKNVSFFFNTFQSDITDIIFINNKIIVSSDDKTVKMFNKEGIFIKDFKGHNGGVWTIGIIGENDFDNVSENNFCESYRSCNNCVLSRTFSGSRSKNEINYNSSNKSGNKSKNEINYKLNNSNYNTNDKDNFSLVTGSTDKSIRIINNSHFLKFKAHKSTVRVIRCLKNLIISGGRDSSINIWSKNGILIRTFKKHVLAVRIIEWKDNLLISGGYDGNVFCWTVYDFEKILINEEERIFCHCYYDTRNDNKNDIDSLDSKDNKKNKSRKFRNFQFKFELQKHLSRVYSVSISKNYIISAGSDNLINVNLRNGKFLYKVDGHHSIIPWIFIIQAYEQENIDYIKKSNNLITKKNKFIIPFNKFPFYSDKYLISGGADGQILIFDLETKKIFKKIREHSPITAFYFFNNWLFAGMNSQIKAYKINTDFSTCIVDNLDAVYKIVGNDGIVIAGCRRNGQVGCYIFDFLKYVL